MELLQYIPLVLVTVCLVALVRTTPTNFDFLSWILTTMMCASYSRNDVRKLQQESCVQSPHRIKLPQRQVNARANPKICDPIVIQRFGKE
jgi:hypothetical protein